MTERIDKSVTKANWEGKIPIAFSIASSDLASINKPDDIYQMVYRCLYFPLVLNDVIKTFQPFAVKGAEDEVWLSSNGIPLKSHYPIGVLFDMYASPAGILPWKIEVHFRNFPSDRIIKFFGEDSVRSYFNNMIKQTDTMKLGSAKRIMNLSKIDQDQLWEGFYKHNHTMFWGINSKLISSDDAIKGVPFRLYVGDAVLQKMISPTNSSGQPETLETLLSECIPHLMIDPSHPPKVMIQGIVPPLNSHISWLSENMSHPDNFLHIVVH